MNKFFNISEASSIAIHGMVLLVRADKPMNVTQIADVIGSSKHHVAKVMQRLVKAGYLTSQRGPSGGFVLRKAPADIHFLEIYEAIEGPIEITECPMDKQICPFDKCIMNNVTSKMTLEFKNFLSEQTVENYLK